MNEKSRSWIALAAVSAAVVVVMFIGWAPAPDGFIVAAATALGWCRWTEAHPRG